MTLAVTIEAVVVVMIVVVVAVSRGLVSLMNLTVVPIPEVVVPLAVVSPVAVPLAVTRW